MNARWKPNVTVAAVVERDGRFLFVEERKPAGLLINQPAGHLERGESILAAVRREVLEETGYAFEPQHLLGIYLAPGPEDIAYLRFTFAGALGAHDPTRPLDEGIVGTLWLTPQEMRAQRARHRSPILEQCVDDYLRGVRYDLAILQTHPALAGGQGNT
ncbi:NUDIX hydrolase [Pandoraea nosoerga]|uniref:Phosphatase NudJ n=1 Tax=Pandoraea nosoerga TaxID=2508296 RepID=A0A5E4XG77_9BURK|nr:NUDIX hydrolase [Pandoraea nosoerga]MBN4668257.1 NUDIX hydrolase [Pandoraea nosoerga]MBN4677748.1 NUDIX hydrolase [Pandoraea nosoerga]MBN4682724.1 NUDIX hydrolase [Pandoraea nosoerga]MBN4746580.1 NUDIX hydrolase [Pandoraea nosoerga]VVE35195.1 NUDIX hydrolase [Pandoraea nosoerga]